MRQRTEPRGRSAPGRRRPDSCASSEGELLGRSRPDLTVRAGPLCTAVVVAVPSARPATHSAISASTKRTWARSGTSNSPCMCTSRSRATASCFGHFAEHLGHFFYPGAARACQAGHGRQVVAFLGPHAAPRDVVLARQLGSGRT